MRIGQNKQCSLFSRNVDTMDLFMLPRDIRCRVLSLLLGAVKIERDQYMVSEAALYIKFVLWQIIISHK